jgi:hypothetical protein
MAIVWSGGVRGQQVAQVHLCDGTILLVGLIKDWPVLNCFLSDRIQT